MEPTAHEKITSDETSKALVLEETIRRALRKTPQERFDTLRAALHDAEKRGLIPKRDRAAHEKQLLWSIQGQLSRS